ncbi:uncharacterized protein BDZ99DRAFT_103253 [Mytilinidion resinicola]|uniref:Uncharacterized protein n=1 Tax=Mytilinidion resinicola TaxID=574789 RepID=A0A6A6YBV6_9PEZI|nr:uncharacterized protein BDZ99DRAFT_103253 [Mytilinidion resinicola]KAF2806058.1 hypothetical protein BDZ99DRAFT_103253 [Mytilinidion resinicola]
MFATQDLPPQLLSTVFHALTNLSIKTTTLRSTPKPDSTNPQHHHHFNHPISLRLYQTNHHQLAMSGTTFLSLPAELRQHIISGTISAIINKKGYRISTPFFGVCKTLQADINEILPLWLPSASTDPLVLIKTPDPKTFTHFRAFQQLLNERATRLKNCAWLGVPEITIQVFDQIWEGINFNEDKEGLWRMCKMAAVYSTQYSNWIDRLAELPESVKTVKLDLTLGPKEAMPLRTAHTELQKIFWYRALQLIEMISHPPRYLLSPECVSKAEYEVVGMFPEWAEVAMATPSIAEKVYWKGEPVKFGEGLFASFLKNVQEKRQAIKLEMAIAAEMEAKKQQTLVKTREARETMMEKMMHQRDFGRRMSELKKRKREEDVDVEHGSYQSPNEANRQKREYGCVDDDVGGGFGWRLFFRHGMGWVRYGLKK